MAELENVAGMKEGVIDFNHLAEVFTYCGDKLLPMCPADMFFPIFVTEFGMQWAGGCPYEVYQDVENRQIVTYFDLLHAKRQMGRSYENLLAASTGSKFYRHGGS